jgi:hypothetical protein
MNVAPLSPLTYGPLLANELTVIIALTLSAITGLSALALVFISQKRKRAIKNLERQLKSQSESKRLESLSAEA